MLSVLIETKDDEEALARTLSALVPAAVEGVVREVVVCDGGSRDATHRVAEHAGCVWLEGTFAEALGRARGDWLLLLEPGARPLGEWGHAVRNHVASSPAAARFVVVRAPGASILSRLFARCSPLVRGLLIRKADALAANASSAGRLAARMSPLRLDAGLQTAPRRR